MSSTISYSFHISSKKNSLSTSSDVKRAGKHNLRAYKNSDDYDREQVVILEGSDSLEKDIKAIYRAEFDQDVAIYNSTVLPTRKIEDYYRHVSQSRNDIAVQIIVGFGDCYFWNEKGDLTEKEKETATGLFKNQLKKIKELYPDLKVASAVIHYDEIGKTPHMHIVGVPVAECKTGPLHQSVKTKVFTQENLRIAQDVLHETFEMQVKDNPELFGSGTMVKPKEQGRNIDFSKHAWVVQNLNREIEEKERTLEAYTEAANKIESSIEISKENYEALMDEISEENDHLSLLFAKKSKKEHELSDLDAKISLLQKEVESYAGVPGLMDKLHLYEELDRTNKILEQLKKDPKGREIYSRYKNSSSTSKEIIQEAVRK